MLNPEQGNNLIKNWLLRDRTFACSRIGIGGESFSCYEYDKFGKISERSSYWLQNNAGFYGEDSDISFFVGEYKKGISCAELQVVWNMTFLNEVENYLHTTYSKNSLKVHHRSIEPFYFNNPWSEALGGKKVLIIHPFRDTIISQYEKRNDLFKTNVLPKFDLKVIKSPQSISGNKPHSSWKESYEITKNEINRIDFDVALLGCGSYGLPLVNHIRTKLNRTAIYIGGALQIMFGIIGKRWDEMEEISSLYNDHWVRPSEKEIPSNSQVVENGCYW
jgi:hypothetical protein